jgi:predicted dehydrogenase
MKRVAVGVIGVGTFGEVHARIYSEHPCAELVAVSDIDKARAEKVGAAYKAKAYVRYEEMLKDPRIEAVSIVVPDMAHRDPCVAAANAGKHILLEKPLATSVEDGKAILEAVQRNKVTMMVDFMNRWSPPFSLAKKSLDSGEIGELLYINMKLNDAIYVPTKMLSWAGSSSVLWFLGSHAIDLALWLAGSPVEEVFCTSTSKVLKGMGIPTADFYHSVLQFKGGAVANIENSWILPESGPTLFEFTAEIVGTKGKIDIDTARNGCIIKSTPQKYQCPDTYCLVEVAGQMRGFGHTAMDHFISCVAEKKAPWIENASSLRVTELITKLEESVKARRLVKA